MHSNVARQLDEYKVHLLVIVSKAYPHFFTHNTFQKLLLSSFSVHEILEFDISFEEHTFAPEKSLKSRFCDFET